MEKTVLQIYEDLRVTYQRLLAILKTGELSREEEELAMEQLERLTSEAQKIVTQLEESANANEALHRTLADSRR